MTMIVPTPIMRDYHFSPFDPETKQLRAGIRVAFVKVIRISGEDRIRGSIVHEDKRYTLVQTASLRNLLRFPKDKIETRVSFQLWSDELVAVPKLDEAKVVYTQELYDTFGG